jgi:multiple antibiotic resistance protein
VSGYFDATLFGAVFVTLFAIVGQQILTFLGIGIPALQGAGGLLLLIVALEIAVQLVADSVRGFLAEG